MSKRVTFRWRTGLHTDVVAGSMPEGGFSLGSNVYQRKIGALRARGELLTMPGPIEAPHWAINARDANLASVWLYAGQSAIGASDGTVHVDVTPAEYLGIPPATAQPVTGCLINGIPVVNVVNSPPFYWDKQLGFANAQLAHGASAVLPGWPSDWKAGAMRAYRFHLIALGVQAAGVNYADQVSWSDRAPANTLPASWIPSDTNEAGSGTLSQGGGVVVDGLALRDRFFIYKTGGTVYGMDYVGGSQVMQLAPVFNDMTTLTRNCIADVGVGHVVLGDGDIVFHDGHNDESIVDGRMRRAIFGQIDPVNGPYTSFVYGDPVQGEAWICVPLPGEVYPSRAWIWNRGAGGWGVRELPWLPAYLATGDVQFTTTGQQWNLDTQVWNADTTTWNNVPGTRGNLMILGCSPANGFVHVDGSTQQYNGQPMIGNVEVRGLQLREDGNVTVTRVFPKMTARNGQRFLVQVGMQNAPSDPLVYGSGTIWTAGDDEGRGAPCFAKGRYLSMKVQELTDPPVTDAWLFDGVQVELAQGMGKW